MSNLLSASFAQQAQSVNTAVAQAAADAQSIPQPGGCRTLLTRLFKSWKSKGSRPLPSEFPVNASLGSIEELQWFQKSSFKNWRRIPEYVRWMQEYNADFQNDVEYKTKTMIIVRAFLDAILSLTSPAAAPMGLSNFSSDPATKGVVIDHNGQTLKKLDGNPAKITFVGTNGTFFLAPFIETIPQTTNEAICFPVLILPKTSDNDAGAGTRFLYFTFQFNTSIFNNNPGPSPSIYTLRVQEYHNLVPLIKEIQRDATISSGDKDRIAQGIMSMLGSAIASTTVSAYEQGYQEIIHNMMSSKILVPEDFPANATDALFPSPGNEPMDVVFTLADPTQNQPYSKASSLYFDLTSIVGQNPSFQFTERPEIKGYGLQIQVQKAYYGFDPQYTSATTAATLTNTPIGWFTANSLSQDLAMVPLVPSAAGAQLAKPTVFSSITDNIVFTVDESGPTAVLQVLDRQITLTPTETAAPIVYPLFLKRSLASAFQSKQILYDATKGVQGNVTLANMSAFSGMSLPMVQALALNMLRGVCKDSIPVNSTNATGGPNDGPFSYYSTLFNNSADEPIYKSSLYDILAYFCNAQSPTMQINITSSSISLAENQPFEILNPSGTVTAASPAKSDNSKNGPTDPITGSLIEKFNSGINISVGVSQGSDLKIWLNSINATAGAGMSGLVATPAVSAKATFQNGNYTGNQLTSTAYMVSRFRNGAANQANASSSNSNASNANSNANKALVRSVVNRSNRA